MVYHSKNLRKHTYPNAMYQRMTARFQRDLVALLAKVGPHSVLDAGCGEGFVLRRMRRHNASHSLTGFDRSMGAVRYARDHGPADALLLVADIDRMPFRSHSFDAVVCSEVLEHLPDVPTALAELKRVSAGWVLLSVPREPYFRVLGKLAEWLRLGEDPEHIHFWSQRSFARLLAGYFQPIILTTSTLYRLALCRV